jgi:hypothetical protein
MRTFCSRLKDSFVVSERLAFKCLSGEQKAFMDSQGVRTDFKPVVIAIGLDKFN